MSRAREIDNTPIHFGLVHYIIIAFEFLKTVLTILIIYNSVFFRTLRYYSV